MRKKNVQSFIKVNLILIILLLFSIYVLNECFIKDIGKVPKIESSDLSGVSKLHAGIINDIKPKKYKITISTNTVEVVFNPAVSGVEQKEKEVPIVEPQRKYNFSDEDKVVLSKIIQAESGNQSLKGKCLVGKVILNRFATGKYNSIKEVVFERSKGVYQFTPIKDGKYFEAIPTNECYQAIDMLSYGWDESLGAMYFCNGQSSWHNNNLQRLFREGGHVFYK